MSGPNKSFDKRIPVALTSAQVKEIDMEAAKNGLSRSAWMRMVLLRALALVAVLFLFACDAEDPAPIPDASRFFCEEQGGIAQPCCPTFALDPGCAEGLTCRPSALTGEMLCLFTGK